MATPKGRDHDPEDSSDDDDGTGLLRECKPFESRPTMFPYQLDADESDIDEVDVELAASSHGLEEEIEKMVAARAARRPPRQQASSISMATPEGRDNDPEDSSDDDDGTGLLQECKRFESLPTMFPYQLDADSQRVKAKATTRKATTSCTLLDGLMGATGSTSSTSSSDNEEQARKSAQKKSAIGDNPSIVEMDPNGERVITLQAVRREIWKNHCTISMKHLMKIYNIRKTSSKERQQKFREVVKELCTMTTDPVGDRILFLKQHYAEDPGPVVTATVGHKRRRTTANDDKSPLSSKKAHTINAGDAKETLLEKSLGSREPSSDFGF